MNKRLTRIEAELLAILAALLAHVVMVLVNR